MEDSHKDSASEIPANASGGSEPIGARYSLQKMMEEVKIERQESVFGRELVDTTEIEKMFSKRIRRKKRKST